MLKRLQCDEFIENGQTRPAIEFHKGLNAVIGNESGTNSVGKSTFLMILDFVFGGDDYITKSKEVHRNLDPHTFRFEFEFDGQPYYFTRSTDTDDIVTQCDENYEPLENGAMKLSKYWEFLLEKYGLEEYGLTWRGAITRFVRVDRRDTLNREEPFRSAKGEKQSQAIIQMLKLYGQYEDVHDQEEAAKDAENREAAFKDAQKYEYIPRVRNKTEYQNNLDRIDALTVEAEELAAQSSDGLLDLDSVQAEQLRNIERRLSAIKRQRTHLRTQLDDINQSKEEGKKPAAQKDYEDLLRFFPDVDEERLEEVEQFHRDLSRILKKEIKESAESIEAMIEIANDEIQSLEKAKVQISCIPNVARAVLEEYADIRKQLQLLIDANNAYDNREQLHDKAVSEQEKLDKLIVQQMARVEIKLNGLMEEMNNKLYPEAMKAPLLRVESSSKYTFETPDDGGTGMRDKGLILFDLAVLQSSNIPFLVHDSVLLLQIENEVVEKIIEFYSEQTNKQIFIAFDKTATPHAMELLEKAKILHLSRGGNELFGRAWNRGKNKRTAENNTEEE